MAKVLLKDLLFNRDAIELITGEIGRVHRAFPAKAFRRTVLAGFPDRELKARIGWIAECLEACLPKPYRVAAGILRDSLPPPNDPARRDGDFGNFVYAAYGEFVARYGCAREHLAFSLEALRDITQRFSAEDAIRRFLNVFPDETLQALTAWTGDAHYHVRRLCSEGTRPRLPWSPKIAIPVTAPIAILDRLFADPTRFVTRSVANHLNDITRVDPDLVVATLTRWRNTGRQRPEEMEFISRHALRTLVKRGHRAALDALGVPDSSHIKLASLQLPKTVRMNTALSFSFVLRTPRATKAIIDYAIIFRSKTGKLASRKVFKLTQTTLPARVPVAVQKRHMLRERMTTRTLYRGRHEIEILVSGRCLVKAAFTLS